MNITEKIDNFLNEAKTKFKVGQKIKHRDFKNPVEIVELHDDNELYNTADGVAGITVTDGKNDYTLWFDTETLRVQGRSTGKKSENYKKITSMNEDNNINENIKSQGFKNTQTLYSLSEMLNPEGNLSKTIQKKLGSGYKKDFMDMYKKINEVIEIWEAIYKDISSSD